MRIRAIERTVFMIEGLNHGYGRIKDVLERTLRDRRDSVTDKIDTYSNRLSMMARKEFGIRRCRLSRVSEGRMVSLAVAFSSENGDRDSSKTLLHLFKYKCVVVVSLLNYDSTRIVLVDHSSRLQ